MKIKFDPNLDFQKQAIDAVCGIFEGQEICQTNFTVAPLQYTAQQTIPGMENNPGIGNRPLCQDTCPPSRMGFQ